MATLYVLEPGAQVEKEYRHLLVVKDDETLLRAPLTDVSHVVLVGQGVGVTTPALHALLAAGAGLSLVSRTGELLGRLTPPSGKNLELRRRQYAQAADPAFCLEFARQVVTGKLLNYRALALRWSREETASRIEIRDSQAGLEASAGFSGPQAQPAKASTPEDHTKTVVNPGDVGPGGRRATNAEQLARLRDALRQAEAAPDLATLRGAEGAGSKAYFAVLRGCLRPDFTFEKRTRRPPKDPTNALLSLGYTLLGEAIATALEVVGLDPYEGFFHADKYGRPALALDLLEEFRGPVADSVALTLINKRMLTPDDFEEAGAAKGAGVYLNKRGLAIYLREFSERLQAAFTHPLAGRPLTYQKCLEVQARQVAKLIMGEVAEYRPLRVR